MPPRTVRDVLLATEAMFQKEGAWTQGIAARDADGYAIAATDARAVCWCLRGGLVKVAGGNNRLLDSAMSALKVDIRSGLATWNDQPQRTVDEVRQALRQAAARVGGKG